MNRANAVFIGNTGLFYDGAQEDIPVLYAGVVALEVDGAGAEFVGPEGAAGAALEGGVVDDGDAIELDGDMAFEEGDVHLLPFSGGLGRVLGRLDAAVDPAHTVRGGIFYRSHPGPGLRRRRGDRCRCCRL